MKTQTWYAWMCVKDIGHPTIGTIYYFTKIAPNMNGYFKPIMDGEHQKSVEVGE